MRQQHRPQQIGRHQMCSKNGGAQTRQHRAAARVLAVHFTHDLQLQTVRLGLGLQALAQRGAQQWQDQRRLQDLGQPHRASGGPKENLAETLTTVDGDTSEVKPRLATAWADQGNGTWRITLREGVKFHDGAQFNAHSVAIAIERLKNEALTCRDRTKIKGIILTTAVIDGHTIDITADPAQHRQ